MGIRREEQGKMLVDMMVQITKLLTEKGLDQGVAVTIAQDVAKLLAFHWGSVPVYFSAKGLGVKLAEAEVAQGFDGRRDTLIALARKHGLSQTAIYEILERLRQRRKEQPCTIGGE